MDECCENIRHSAQEFARSARLYAEVVAELTCDSGSISTENYLRLRKAVLDAQHRAERAGIAFEEHLELHRRIPKQVSAFKQVG